MNNETSNRQVKQQLCALYDELFAHDGYGELRVEIRFLKRGQKEVILHCGKQHRHIVAYTPAASTQSPAEPSFSGSVTCPPRA
mgnify:CR=1 FL=1